MIFGSDFLFIYFYWIIMIFKVSVSKYLLKSYFSVLPHKILRILSFPIYILNRIKENFDYCSHRLLISALKEIKSLKIFVLHFSPFPTTLFSPMKRFLLTHVDLATGCSLNTVTRPISNWAISDWGPIMLDGWRLSLSGR